MKRLLFLTGTRADFGKLKSLILITQASKEFDVHVFATGMHLNSKYGKTIDEIYKSGICNVYPFINHDYTDFMDRNLSKTIDGFSHYVNELKPDLIIVHGDRVEALAGAIVGSLNNILVAHIEGGERSGTIDELIRHSVSKLSHLHLVSNNEAKKRLVQMGELESSIEIIGSPDLDILLSDKIESIEKVKKYYDIKFENYAIFLFHPVTTEMEKWEEYTNEVFSAVEMSEKNYIIIYPNNDLGSDIILKKIKKLKDRPNFKIYPSLRFEYFISLLKNAEFIIGNSSVGIREAPYLNIPTINIGSRQNSRASFDTIVNCDYSREQVYEAIQNLKVKSAEESYSFFGAGDSDKKFLELLSKDEIWNLSRQKCFQDIII